MRFINDWNGMTRLILVMVTIMPTFQIKIKKTLVAIFFFCTRYRISHLKSIRLFQSHDFFLTKNILLGRGKASKSAFASRVACWVTDSHLKLWGTGIPSQQNVSNTTLFPRWIGIDNAMIKRYWNDFYKKNLMSALTRKKTEYFW